MVHQDILDSDYYYYYYYYRVMGVYFHMCYPRLYTNFTFYYTRITLVTRHPVYFCYPALSYIDNPALRRIRRMRAKGSVEIRGHVTPRLGGHMTRTSAPVYRSLFPPQHSQTKITKCSTSYFDTIQDCFIVRSSELFLRNIYRKGRYKRSTLYIVLVYNIRKRY